VIVEKQHLNSCDLKVNTIEKLLLKSHNTNWFVIEKSQVTDRCYWKVVTENSIEKAFVTNKS